MDFDINFGGGSSSSVFICSFFLQFLETVLHSFEVDTV